MIVGPARMIKADLRKAPEQGKMHLLDKPIAGPAVVALPIRQTEHPPPIIKCELATSGLAVSGNSPPPIGVIAVRLGRPFQEGADLADKPLCLRSRLGVGRRQRSGVEHDRVARVLAMACSGPR